MNGKFSVLNKIAALGIGLGLFQVLAAQGLFKQFQGGLFYLPLALILGISFFICGKFLTQKNKKNRLILIALAFFGFLAASFWGQKAFEQQLMNQPGVIKVE